jgi:hypothetical protein
VDWRRLLVYTHRWLGIAGCVLFATWFASGIVMMYARMPELGGAERRARRPPIDFTTARVSPADALAADAPSLQRLRLGMAGDRPVYRAIIRGRWTTIFADDGRRLTGLTRDEALAEGRRFAPARAAALRYDALLVESDQWTLESRQLLPMHRLAFDDADGTVLYVSDRTGEPEVKTTRPERRWAYAGAVLHWIYFTPLRRNTAAWSQSIIWLSMLGCVMCLSGLVWGAIVAWRSPYAGVMRWHHYAGLIFGVTTCTWIFSGLLSMDPWDWHPGTAPTREQREAVSGGALHLGSLTIERVRAALRAMPPASEIDVVQFRGDLFLAADQALVPVLAPERGVVSRFPDGDIEDAARAAMPGIDIEDAAWLHAYDAYYYDRRREQPLPVLRVRFADPPRTWLYLDPGRGAIVRKEERLTRINRWLYHGLHSLDFPFLYDRRPLWDIVMIALSVGGLASAATSLLPAWRRLRRHALRLMRGAGVDSRAAGG